MLQKTVGIVLHSLKYNDTSNIVDIYTQHTGRASFLVKIPRSRKSTVKSVLFQPLAMRSEEHTSELQSPLIISYAVFCLKKKSRTHGRLSNSEQSKKK